MQEALHRSPPSSATVLTQCVECLGHFSFRCPENQEILLRCTFSDTGKGGKKSISVLGHLCELPFEQFLLSEFGWHVCCNKVKLFSCERCMIHAKFMRIRRL